MDNIEQLRKRLEDIFLKEGITDKVIELSRKLDDEIVKIQLDRFNKLKDEE